MNKVYVLNYINEAEIDELLVKVFDKLLGEK